MQRYGAVIERAMKNFFDSLSEKDRRRYAAVEVAKFGQGGLEYVARVLGCDVKTIQQGREELEQAEDPAAGRVQRDLARLATVRHWRRMASNISGVSFSVLRHDLHRPAQFLFRGSRQAPCYVRSCDRMVQSGAMSAANHISLLAVVESAEAGSGEPDVEKHTGDCFR